MTIETSNRSDEDLGIEQAAEMLRISPRTLLKKLDAGEIAFHYAASERRVAVADLLDYRRRQKERAQASLEQMRDEADELDLYS
jgi:excisionase family DNA binding protein